MIAAFSSRRLLQFLMAFSFFAESCAFAAPAATQGLQIEIAKQLTEIAADQMRSPRDIAFFGAMAGLNKESVRLIREDLEKSLGREPWPQIQLKSDQFFVAGKATGVKISSYVPLNVMYREKTWAYDTNQLTEKNYFSLKKFLSLNRQASLLDLLIPEAHGDIKDIVAGGLAATIISGGIGLGLVGGFSMGPFGASLAVFAIPGLGLHKLTKMRQNRLYVTEVLCSQRLTVEECGETVVLKLRPNGKDDKDLRKILVAGSHVSFTDLSGKEVWPIFDDRPIETEKQKELIFRLRDACKAGDKNFKEAWSRSLKYACSEDNLGGYPDWSSKWIGDPSSEPRANPLAPEADSSKKSGASK